MVVGFGSSFTRPASVVNRTRRPWWQAETAERGREHGLAGAGVADEDDRLAVIDPGAFGERGDRGLRDFGVPSRRSPLDRPSWEPGRLEDVRPRRGEDRQRTGSAHERRIRLRVCRTRSMSASRSSPSGAPATCAWRRTPATRARGSAPRAAGVGKRAESRSRYTLSTGTPPVSSRARRAACRRRSRCAEPRACLRPSVPTGRHTRSLTRVTPAR